MKLWKVGVKTIGIAYFIGAENEIDAKDIVKFIFNYVDSDITDIQLLEFYFDSWVRINEEINLKGTGYYTGESCFLFNMTYIPVSLRDLFIMTHCSHI